MPTSFAAFDRLKQTLAASGLDEESVSFIIGKYTHAATDTVVAEVVKIGGEEALKKLMEGDQTEGLANLEAQFKEAKGISIAEFREQVAEEMVKEFETAE